MDNVPKRSASGSDGGVSEADPKVVKPSAFVDSKGVGAGSLSNPFVLGSVSSWTAFLPGFTANLFLGLGALTHASCTTALSRATGWVSFSKGCGTTALNKSEAFLVMVICLSLNSKDQCKSGAIF
jgi:hypothetical protein